MPKLLKRASLVLFALFAACIDQVMSGPDPMGLPKPAFNVALTQCENTLTTANGQELITTVYAYLNNSSAAVAQGAWTTITSTTSAAPDKENAAWTLADDVLTKKQTFGLASTTDIRRLINVAFCKAGVRNAGFPGGDGWVVRPGENADTVHLLTTGRYAGFVLPANTITTSTGPRLFAISPSTATLNSPLDQYGTPLEFSSYPTSDFPGGIYVGQCAGAPSTLNTGPLVLGHNISGTGQFEVLPPTPAAISWTALLECIVTASSSTSSIGCETAIASAGWSMLDRLWAALLPRQAHATVLTGGCGGVGGTLSQLSPVRPLDPTILVSSNTPPTTGPAGFPVWPSPAVTLRTPKGVLLSGIPVTFTVAAGFSGGVLPPGTVVTNASGVASKDFWTLPTATNVTSRVVATPGLGGPAVSNVRFSPSGIAFNATSSATSTSIPNSIQFTTQPATSYRTAGATATVRATVYAGSAAPVVATNYNGPVTFESSTGQLGGQRIVQAVNGVATANVIFERIGSGQTLTARAAYGSGLLSATSTAFSVSEAASPARIVRTDASVLVSDAGSNLGVLPKFRVEDLYGNLVTKRTIYFQSANNGSLLAPASASTGTTSTGAGPTTWPLRFGRNTMIASMDASVNSDSRRWVEIPADGRATSTTGDVYKACEPGGSTPEYLNVTTYAPRLSNLSATDKLQRITNVKMFMNSPGSPARVGLRMVVQKRNATSGAWTSTGSDTARVVFRGTAGEQKEVNFRAVAEVSLAGSDMVVFQVVRVGSTRTVNFTRTVPDKTGCDFNTATLSTLGGASYRTSAAIRIITRQ